jgi:Protein of unknown function (DUF1759)
MLGKMGEAGLEDETFVQDIYAMQSRLDVTLRSIRKTRNKVKNEAMDAKMTETILIQDLKCLSLLKFNGGLDKWAAFWDSFEATVHNRKDIGSFEKMMLLPSRLEGASKKSINHISIVHDNYDLMVELLKNTFCNPNANVLSFYKKIMSLPAKFDESQSCGNLTLISEVFSVLNYDKSGNLNLQTFITFMFIEKLSLSMKRENFTTYKKDANLVHNNLVKFMGDHCEFREINRHEGVRNEQARAQIPYDTNNKITSGTRKQI